MTKKLSDTKDLKKLGSATTYTYEGADKGLLERFPNPLTKGPGVGAVNIRSPEFTSLCPLTGQPDFATIVVDYIPNKWCVESKAWKLYLGSYRQFGEFHESCVRRIANDLIELLDPYMLRVVGEFMPRGGIPFWPTITYTRPEVRFDLVEQPRVLEDKNIFFLGETIFEKIEAQGSDECGIFVDGNMVGSARMTDWECGEWDEMARKYAATNFMFKDRKRLKAYLEECFNVELDDESMVTVVWFKDVVFFKEEQDLGDASGIVPLHEKDD